VRPAAEDGARLRRAQLARRTFGISPASLMLAYADWLAHFAIAPDKHEALARKAVRQGQRLAQYAAHAWSGDCPPCIEPLVQDRRFSDAAWQRWPYNAVHQGFLLYQQWIHGVTTGARVGWDELPLRLSERPRRLGAARGGPATGRRRGVRGRGKRRGHAGQGGLPQPADRAHPVRTDHTARASRAGPRRPGLDHESTTSSICRPATRS
jgi:hypothetical protein